MNRRALLRTAAWTAPVAIVTVTPPVYATSDLRSVLVFTNLTATVGKDARTVYVNTKVQTTEGEPVPGLVVTVSIGTDARLTEHVLDPWGATDLIRHEYRGQPLDGPITVAFWAEAPGVEPIAGEVTVTPPTWWAEQ